MALHDRIENPDIFVLPSPPPTKEPVTVSGWYERTDGTVAYYRWRESVLFAERVVASWADVPRNEHQE